MIVDFVEKIYRNATCVLIMMTIIFRKLKVTKGPAGKDKWQVVGKFSGEVYWNASRSDCIRLMRYPEFIGIENAYIEALREKKKKKKELEREEKRSWREHLRNEKKNSRYWKRYWEKIRREG